MRIFIQSAIAPPFVSKEHFEECISLVKSEMFDSSFTAERIQHLLWKDNAEPLNFDPSCVPRTQDLPTYYSEVSAAYVFERNVFLRYRR